MSWKGRGLGVIVTGTSQKSFTGDSAGKEPACQCRRYGFNPWVRKTPWRRAWLPTAVFLPGELQGQRSLANYSPWVATWDPCVGAKLLQSCPTLCDPMDCSPPGSSVHGLLQAGTLEWVAMPFSRVIFLTQNIVGTQQIFILIPQMRKSFGENKRATDMRFLCSNDHQLIIFPPSPTLFTS